MHESAIGLSALGVLENKRLRRKPARKSGYSGLLAARLLLACILVSLPIAKTCAGAQSQPLNPSAQSLPDSPRPTAGTGNQPAQFDQKEPATIQWQGLTVRKISFEGISVGRLSPVPEQLQQQPGKPLNANDVRESLRKLYATGLFESIEVAGVPDGDGVDLIFRGVTRNFIGTVWVDGAKGGTMNAQLQRASQLSAGTRFTGAKLATATRQMRDTLAENGFYEPQITHEVTPHPNEQLMDIAFKVVSGPQARIGQVEVSGDAGMSVASFRHYAHLKNNAHVDRDTGNRALAGVLKHYRGEERMEAEIKLVSAKYDAQTRTLNYSFSANQGPTVRVLLEGANLSSERLKRIIPIFEEGSVDEDLLNEGNRRLRDYYQQLGYFDVKVNHAQRSTSDKEVVIAYSVQLGQRHRVSSVNVQGNKYFDSDTLKALLSVHAADTIDRHGIYSQALVSADIGALEGVYRNNGFADVKVTPKTSKPDDGSAESTQQAKPKNRTAQLIVNYRINEGQQIRVGEVKLDGNEHIEAAKLTLLMNTAPGQLLSPQNLAGDRDALVSEYLNRGFEQVAVEVTQQPEAADASKMNVVFLITEGPQIFVRNVLLTGLHYTRPTTVERAITLHSGDALNQTALLDTQRNLYDLSLFNEVDAAVENPYGGDTRKTVLLQAVEARRWALTYGVGFEAQTGTPQNNCAGATNRGVACNPNGTPGVSPRVLAAVTRNNLFGREQSASLQGTYGLLEQRIDLLFQIPHFQGHRNFSITFNGGYANSKDVTTYVASRLQGGFRFTQNFQSPGAKLSKANTFIYEYDFRRVKVAFDSLQVFPAEIQELATAVRVAGPGFTWIRDTRDSTLDAHRGTYTSFQDFLSKKPIGAEVEFNRLDISNSSYWGFDKNRFVLARNTRYGQVRAFGVGQSRLIPLPERLYAGGPTSLRGFSFNAAGPRDPETGFPIGGAGALINSTELRLPPPTLPWLGNSVSFVLFHDMGNVFTNAGDAWASIARLHQPDRDTCKVLSQADFSTNPPTAPSPSGPTKGPVTSTGRQGICRFDYFTHAPGLGLRYHTPIGPIRLDFSYNLNPPIFPVNIDYAIGFSTTNPEGPYSSPHVGQAPHFNFFFSLGQTF
jgi:outer membrane protein assembly complex protein YaeT